MLKQAKDDTKKTESELGRQISELTSEIQQKEVEIAKLQVSDKTQGSTANFSPECEDDNEKSLILAKVNKEPVLNHNIYVFTCKEELTKINPLWRVAVLEANYDGTEKFVYGASSLEPLCVSSKILPENVAKEINTSTGIGICRTY